MKKKVSVFIRYRKVLILCMISLCPVVVGSLAVANCPAHNTSPSYEQALDEESAVLKLADPHPIMKHDDFYVPPRAYRQLHDPLAACTGIGTGRKMLASCIDYNLKASEFLMKKCASGVREACDIYNDKVTKTLERKERIKNPFDEACGFVGCAAPVCPFASRSTILDYGENIFEENMVVFDKSWFTLNCSDDVEACSYYLSSEKKVLRGANKFLDSEATGSQVKVRSNKADRSNGGWGVARQAAGLGLLGVVRGREYEIAGAYACIGGPDCPASNVEPNKIGSNSYAKANDSGLHIQLNGALHKLFPDGRCAMEKSGDNWYSWYGKDCKSRGSKIDLTTEKGQRRLWSDVFPEQYRTVTKGEVNVDVGFQRAINQGSLPSSETQRIRRGAGAALGALTALFGGGAIESFFEPLMNDIYSFFIKEPFAKSILSREAELLKQAKKLFSDTTESTLGELKLKRLRSNFVFHCNPHGFDNGTHHPCILVTNRGIVAGDTYGKREVIARIGDSGVNSGESYFVLWGNGPDIRSPQGKRISPWWKHAVLVAPEYAAACGFYPRRNAPSRLDLRCITTKDRRFKRFQDERAPHRRDVSASTEGVQSDADIVD